MYHMMNSKAEHMKRGLTDLVDNLHVQEMEELKRDMITVAPEMRRW